MARRGEGSVGLAGWERTQQRQQQANAAGGGRTTGGSRSLQQRNYCGSRQVGDDVWEKQRTKGLYDEGLKKAAKGDALAGMERCHPGKEGPPESSWAGAGHSLLLHHRHHGKTSTTAPPRNPPQPTAHSPHTHTNPPTPACSCLPAWSGQPSCLRPSCYTCCYSCCRCHGLPLSVSVHVSGMSLPLFCFPSLLPLPLPLPLPSATAQQYNNNNNNNKTPHDQSSRPLHSTHDTLPDLPTPLRFQEPVMVPT
ncbi:hypothetical protein COCVIDRAFT_16602 [Bipolaris victoriae FI3]|uniref:Uncharacterized protein n=1 Tax=Bipolaris victoriae (strain FI3) TaxID=930091 RepID=W7E7H7_BIPV3|nr:hypothetical protein COCVIDRAFT_16602 [Bipolaris victoriae FI3]